MSRPEMFLVDEPPDAFICDPHQLFRGWLACHDGSPTRYTLKFDGEVADVSWDSRPDVEAAYPDYAALGWQAHCDTLKLICESKRSVTLSVWLDGTQVASRRFLISRCLAPDPAAHGPIFWIHIARSGGTSLRSALSQCCSPERTLYVYGDYPGIPATRLSDLSQTYVNSRDLVFGHFDFGIHQALGIREARYATVLRDPSALITSYLDFADAKLANFLDNPQTRHLSGTYGLDAPVTREHLAEAKRNAESFVHIGFLESMDATMAWLAEAYDVPLPQLDHLNRSTRRTAAPGGVIDLDIELYNWCRERFAPDQQALTAA